MSKDIIEQMSVSHLLNRIYLLHKAKVEMTRCDAGIAELQPIRSVVIAVIGIIEVWVKIVRCLDLMQPDCMSLIA